MHPSDLSAALEQIALGFHSLSVAVAGGTPSSARPSGVANRTGEPSPPRTCAKCGAPLERRQTKSGDPVLRCPEWRWNGGESNGHDSEFVK